MRLINLLLIFILGGIYIYIGQNYYLLTIMLIIIFFYYNFLKSIFLFTNVKWRKFLKIIARDWFYTTNHKKLGFFYIIFAIISGLIGTTLASLIRLELSQPGSMIFNNNGGSYHITVAIHAILMVFFVVTPVVFGGFGNYFLPVQVGARDVAYPRLNNFSVWLLPAGLISILRSLWDGARIFFDNTLSSQQYSGSKWLWEFTERNIWAAYESDGGVYSLARHKVSEELQSVIKILPPNQNIARLAIDDLTLMLPYYGAAANLNACMAGWTFTTPFSHSRFTGRAVDMALVGLVFSTITSIMTTINLISTWRFLRGRGARYQRELFPIFLISVFISLRLLLAVSPILTAGFIMLIADRHFYTAFFTVRAGGDVLLFQHIFWFFGHPEVYILVIPGFGVASTLIPYYTRKPISSKMHMVYAMHSIACMSFVVWGHHMYLVGIDSKARTLFMTITIMIALPSTVKICGWLVSLTNGITFPTLELWLAVTFVSVFFIGGMSGLMVGGAGLDILLHDTYYVVGHFHVMLSGAMILSVMGWIYFNFRELSGVGYSWIFSGLHLSGHLIGHLTCFIPMLWLGYAGMPRRVQDYPSGYAGWHSVASFGHILVLAGLLCFFITLAHASYFKRPLGGRHGGLPFLATRASFIFFDKYVSAWSMHQHQLIGVKFMRAYIDNC